MEEQFYVSSVKVGKKVDNFEAQAVLPNGEFAQVSLADNLHAKKWSIIFFWPLDFTFVCPTEITALSNAYEQFKKEDAEIFGISTDSIHSHLAWTKTAINDGGIGKINFPILQDTNHKIAEQFGVLVEDEGIALRGLFIISPEGILESATINNLNVGRSVSEILRTLTAFKSGGLCAMNWEKGDKNL